jgi:uridylate kinase
MASYKETIVISVGGSLIVPGEIDSAFLEAFKTLIEKGVAEGKRFVIITGGGMTARSYQRAARNISTLTSEDVDWLGIHATRLNAHLLRAIFFKDAHPVIIKDPTRKILAENPILIAAGWKPGWSTDYDAVLLAKNLDAKKVVNLSNIDYVYTKDPRKFPDATAIPEISWSEFRKMLPAEWDPGLHVPFDPVASKKAEVLGLEVVIMNGKKLEELEHYLDGKKFIGTVIK